MEVHSEVHLTGIAEIAVSMRRGGGTDTHNTRASRRMPSLPRDSNIDPVVRDIGRGCPTWPAL